MSDTMSDVLLSLALGFFVILVIVPIVGVVLLTLFDAIFREDIGISRLFWLAAILFIPLGGMLLYWLARPKDFNPLIETREAATYPAGVRYVSASPAEVAAPTPIRQPQAAAISSEEDDGLSEREAA